MAVSSVRDGIQEGRQAVQATRQEPVMSNKDEALAVAMRGIEEIKRAYLPQTQAWKLATACLAEVNALLRPPRYVAKEYGYRGDVAIWDNKTEMWVDDKETFQRFVDALNAADAEGGTGNG